MNWNITKKKPNASWKTKGSAVTSRERGLHDAQPHGVGVEDPTHEAC